jgi:uncharacterized membrane protein YfcA
MVPLVLAAIVFAAAILQTLSGFGFSLIVMPLVTLAVGLRAAGPLVALAGLTLYSLNIIRYRAAFNWREAWRLALAAALGVPVGLWAVITVNEAVIRPILGVILIGYAAFALAMPRLVPLGSADWGYLAGFAAGCLGGAYNTPGPPIVVYGSLRQWPKDEFRAILQTIFFLTGSLTVASHAAAQHLTPEVLTAYAAAAPALLFGLFVGARLDRRVNQARFRTLVAIMLLLLGLSLIVRL